MTMYKYLVQGFQDFQYDTKLPDNVISFEIVTSKTELKKLQKNKEDYGEYFLD